MSDKDIEASAKEKQNQDEKSSLNASEFSIMLLAYLKDQGQQPLYVIHEGTQCALSIQPESGHLRFKYGNDHMLVKLHPKAFLTKSSAAELKAWEQQRDNKKAESALTADGSDFRSYIQDALEGRRPKKLSELPEITEQLTKFEKAFNENPYGGSVRDEYYEHSILFKNTKAAQCLRKIFNFLSEQKNIDVFTNKLRTNKPHMGLYIEKHSEVEVLMLEIAKIAKCEAEVIEFLNECQDKKNYLIIWRSGGKENSFDEINSAYFHRGDIQN